MECTLGTIIIIFMWIGVGEGEREKTFASFIAFIHSIGIFPTVLMCWIVRIWIYMWMCACLSIHWMETIWKEMCVCMWCVIVSYFIVIFWMPAGTHTFITEPSSAHAIDFNLWTYYTHLLPLEMDALWHVCMCAFLSPSMCVCVFMDLTHPLSMHMFLICGWFNIT